MNSKIAQIIEEARGLLRPERIRTERIQDDWLISFEPGNDGALALYIRTGDKWAFLSFGAFDGGLEFSLDTELSDLRRVFESVSAGNVTIHVIKHRRRCIFSSVDMDAGYVLRASLGLIEMIGHGEVFHPVR
ncbi:MAG: hypothetical protein J0I11_19655 [Actinobacteria bacterium]|jgi:hypothetical protein|nr:hypothetical protein [Actinomycetota bacterium]